MTKYVFSRSTFCNVNETLKGHVSSGCCLATYNSFGSHSIKSNVDWFQIIFYKLFLWEFESDYYFGVKFITTIEYQNEGSPPQYLMNAFHYYQLF